MTGRMFNIATDYQTYLTCKTNSTKQNRSDPSNIFGKNLLARQNHQDLFTSKSYEIVGLKELKSLENKLRKGKKNTYRKETYLREDTSREDDRQKLLTKKEVVDSLPKIQLKKMHPGYFNTDITQISQDKTSLNHLQSTFQSHDFSLSRLKEVIKLRNEEWRKIQVKTDRQDPKFPSVYKSIDTYRNKVEEKLKNTKSQNLHNQISQKWPNTLRRDLSLADLTLKKSVTKTFHDDGEFTTRGHSKFKAQQQWLQRKSQDGYNFKKLALNEAIQGNPSESIC